MRFVLYFIAFVTLLGFGTTLNSCKKITDFSSGNLDFSADTIIFDTVFTTVGSTTKRLKIYNKDSKVLNIEAIELMGGANSPFRINVDGLSGLMFADIQLEPKDSLFIFVEVTLDANNQNNPMVIEDQIRFRTNGTDQYVQLVAWGQDAYFHVSVISQNIFDTNEGIWPNDKPHVIYGAAYVDEGKTLEIPAGTQIYLHKNAFLFNYKGTLKIKGTKDNPVTLQGDRLESYYDDVSGQYYGIYFFEARPSIIEYAVIKNAITGIHVEKRDEAFNDYTVSVSNTRIQNSAAYGVLLFEGARMKAENCIISHSGIHGLTVIGGADFNFNYCNILGYGSGQSVAAAVGIANYYVNPDTKIPEFYGINEGRITNSVIYGNLDYEVAIDTISGTGLNINLDFQRNLIKSEVVFTNGFTNGNIWNEEPWFYDPSKYDFHLWGVSPLNNAADPGILNVLPLSMGVDIEQKPRSGPDIGAYEVN